MTRSILTRALLALAAVAIISQVLSQDAKPSNQSAPTPTREQAYLDKSAAYATPNDHHKVLSARIGKWHDTLKFWADASSPAHQSTCTSEFAWAMDGRYLTERTSGATPGGTFEGMGWSGYDNLKNRYVKAWIDNTLTGIMYFEGDYDAKTKTFTYASQTPDVEAGKYVQNRWTEKWVTPDRYVVESFVADNDGKEFKCFEITYERSK
jgi:Protein of unknown function (DUF1579)